MSQQAAVTGAALGAVALGALLALLALPACSQCDSSLDPVKCTDLCTQDPPHRDCAQCSGDEKAGNCPQCTSEPRDPRCLDVASGGTGGTSGTGGANGGTGGMSGTGGAGGTAGVVDGGGMGGTDAGMLPVDCTTSDDCEFPVPRCSSERLCAPCEDSAVCVETEEARVICDTAGAMGPVGGCVQCRDDDDCNASGATPHCVAGLCEECATHADCSGDLDAPQCNDDHVCVACTDDSACDEHGVRQICDTRAPETTETEGRCIQCLTHSSCPNDRPQCGADGMCGACDAEHESEVCSGRMNGDTPLGQCNTRLDLDTSGQCVNCTADNEASADGCGDFACNQNLGVCTEVERETRNPCQACEADSQCDMGMKCLRHVLNGEDLGTFCFFAKSENNGCSDTRAAVRPFSITQNLPSLDGPLAEYCLPPTSCLAYLDTISGAIGKSCMASTDCGVGNSAIDNALCIGAVGDAHCTYICNADNQCPITDQPDCSGSPSGHCQPQP